VAQAEAVEQLLASSPVPGIMPTMTSPVVREAIRDSAYNGILEGAYVGSYRTAGKVGTQSGLNFLFNFNIARPVQAPSSNPNSSNGKNSRLKVNPSCTPLKDKNGKTTGEMCGPYIID
jgi:hypothetical protein